MGVDLGIADTLKRGQRNIARKPLSSSCDSQPATHRTSINKPENLLFAYAKNKGTDQLHGNLVPLFLLHR